MFANAICEGPHDPPVFGGGSLPSPAFHPASWDSGRAVSEAANHNRLRQIEESGCRRIDSFSKHHVPYPPLCERWNIVVRSGRNIKNTTDLDRLSQPISSRSAKRTARHGFGNSSGLVEIKLASLKRETRFAAGFPIAFHRNER